MWISIKAYLQNAGHTGKKEDHDQWQKGLNLPSLP